MHLSKYAKNVSLNFVLILLLGFSKADAQDKEARMTYFQGGRYDIRFSISSSLLYGIGSRSAGLGASITTLRSDPSSLYWNPAGLAFLKRLQILLEATPTIMVDPLNYVDVQKDINEMIDSVLVEFDAPLKEVTHPQFDIALGQSGGLISGGLAIPYSGFVFAANTYQPLKIRLRILGNGLRSMIETQKEIGKDVTVIQFSNNMDMNLAFELDAIVSSFGLAREILPGWALGAACDYYVSRSSLNARCQLEGIMLLRQKGSAEGKEYAFNDPNDPNIRFEEGEQNDLNQWAVGSYEGQGWGMKIGISYHPKKRWSIDAVFSRAPTLNMRGKMEFIQNKIPALNIGVLTGEAEEDEEIFDVTKLSLSRPTLTERVENRTDSVLVIKLPSSLNFGTAVDFRFGIATLNLGFYFGEFSYKYLEYHQGLRLKHSYRLGLEFKFPWFLSPETALLKLAGIEPQPQIRIGGGIITANEIRKGFGDENENDAHRKIWIPSFSFGKGFSLGENLKVDALLLAVPAPILRASFAYSF